MLEKVLEHQNTRFNKSKTKILKAHMRPPKDYVKSKIAQQL